MHVTLVLPEVLRGDLLYLVAGKSSDTRELTPSVLGNVFILIIWHISTASEIHVGVKIVQVLDINLLTSIDIPNVNKIV